MTRRILIASVATVTLALSACATEKSSTPLSPAIAGPIPGVNISAPRTVQPANGTKVAVDQQPVTLMVGNATTSGVRPLNYLFEVATDANFTNKVFSRDSITPGDGQTSLRLPDALATEHTYYWRARAQDGANTGPYSSPADFNVFTPVVIQAPVPIAPINNVTVTSLRPRFSFTNAPRTGPAGPITYLVEVSDTNTFATSAVQTVAEQSGGQTNLDPTKDFPAARQVFWHVRAADPTTIGPFSATQVFQTPAAAAPPPPPPGNGGGGGGGADQIDVSQVTFVDNPPELGSWATTAKITYVQFRSDAMIVDFNKRTGSGQWPNFPFDPGGPPDPGGGGIQYTLGLCFNLSGHWYCSAAIQFWQGRDLEAAASPSSIPFTWYYDGRWAPMNGYLPAQGEMVGIFVVAGNVRGVRNGSLAIAKERSGIVLVPFDRGSGTSFNFSVGALPFSGGR